MDSAINYDELILADRVHGRLYYDEQIFREELEKIWHRVWVYLGHESEVAQPGDYVSRRIGLQPVVMTRDEDGKIHCFLNRCTHRGNTICEYERGNAHAFRCAYHGWTFANDGRLIGVTHSKAYGENFRKEDLGLSAVPRLGSYRGFVFVSLSPTGISLDEHLGYAKKLLDQAVNLSPLGEVEARAGEQKTRYRANWKVQLENSVDNYHAGSTHKTFNDYLQRRTGMDVAEMTRDDSGMEMHYLGNGHAALDFRPIQRKAGLGVLSVSATRSKADEEYVRLMEASYGKERAAQIIMDGPPHFTVFPNLVLIGVQARRIQPVAANLTDVSYFPLFLKGAPKEINVGRLRQHEIAFGPAAFTSPDDIEMFERQQVAMQAKLNEWQLLRRGLGRERVDSRGIVSGHLADETHFLRMWGHYRDLMTQP
jgi:phenylpropionate dioxygenase-like ring-hydroxylating dioxygenase large terminal subunit